MKKTMTVGSVLPFVLIAWAAAVFAYYTLERFEEELKQDLQAIEAGEAHAYEYTLIQKYVQKSRNSTDDHMIVLEGPQKESLGLTYEEYDRAYVGQKLLGYHVNGRVRFLEFIEPPTGNAKWVMSGFCFLLGAFPLGFIAICRLVSCYRHINREPRNGNEVYKDLLRENEKGQEALRV